MGSTLSSDTSSGQLIYVESRQHWSECDFSLLAVQSKQAWQLPACTAAASITRRKSSVEDSLMSHQPADPGQIATTAWANSPCTPTSDHRRCPPRADVLPSPESMRAPRRRPLLRLLWRRCCGLAAKISATFQDGGAVLRGCRRERCRGRQRACAARCCGAGCGRGCSACSADCHGVGSDAEAWTAVPW